MPSPTIAIAFPLTEKHKNMLQATAPRARFHFLSAGDLIPTHLLPEIEIFMGNPTPDEIKAMPSLRWLQLASSGANDYLAPDAIPSQVTVTTATGAYGQSVAEHAFALLFALLKNLHLYRDNQQKQLWQSRGQVFSLCDATVLIVGLGDIGSHFATMVRPLSKAVWGINQSATPNSAVDEVYPLDQLDKLLPQVDVVLLSLPETEKTKGLFSRHRFSLLKPTALLLNVGRGTLVDTDALVEAAAQEKLWGAGIDVTDPEPLPADHPLWKQERVLLTPHSSGGLHLPQTLDYIVSLWNENLQQYLQDKPLSSQLSLTTGYAK